MIQARGLSKRFGRVQAVMDVGFEIGAGSVVGFLGPNGAGKSTTMRLLTGFLAPDSGSVEIAGEPMGASPLAARARLGYLPEHTPLYPGMRVDDYLVHAARLRGLPRERRRRALARAVEDTGLGSMLTRRIRTLSKGYRQRVGLAQALVADPEVLILDEPTSGLDPVEVGRMRSLVRDLGEERTVLLSTHVLDEVEELCSRVLIMAGGRLVADDEFHALRRRRSRQVELTLAGDPRVLVPAISAAPFVDDVQVRAESSAGGVCELRVDIGGELDADRAASMLAESVVASGVRLVRLEVRRESLRDVFLRATRSEVSA